MLARPHSHVAFALFAMVVACGKGAETETETDTDDTSEESGPPPVLHIVSMMHAEDSVDFHEQQSVFMQHADALNSLGVLFQEHGAKIDFGPDWTFILGVNEWDDTVLTDHVALGHGIQTHAHESHRTISEVNALLAQAGIQKNPVANGGWTGTLPDGLNWIGYVAGLDDPEGDPLFTSAIGYKNPDNQVPDSHGYCFRASTTGDWTVEDTDSPIFYIGSNTVAEPGEGALDFDTVRPWIDDRLENLDPTRVNTLYWHDTLHNYSNQQGAADRIERWETELTEYFDPLVAEGRIEWHTFEEMRQICEEAE